MKLTIRPAVLADVETILDFMVDYYEIEGVGFNRELSRQTLGHFIGSGENGALFMVLSASGEPQGYFCLAFSYTLASYGKDCFIDELYLKPSSRGSGIGSQVMQFIEQYLTENGFKGIHLVVYDINPKAHAFYIKNRFEDNQASFMTKSLIS